MTRITPILVLVALSHAALAQTNRTPDPAATGPRPAPAATAAPPAGGPNALSWSKLPPLPPAPGQTEQIGVAGPFTGLSGGALIVAGGANFPAGAPWEGGRKIYHDDIFVLLPGKDGKDPHWQTVTPKLPGPLAYGVAVETERGLLCLGGEWKEDDPDDPSKQIRKLSDKVFLIVWDVKSKSVRIENSFGESKLPPLPKPATAMAGAAIGSVVYVAGGDTGNGGTKNFWRLDLGQHSDRKKFQWKELPSWPGPARVLPIAAVQSDGEKDCFYLISGRHKDPAAGWQFHSDAYRFRPDRYDSGNPKATGWKRLRNVMGAEGDATSGRSVMAGTAAPSGANHILVFSGAYGDLFRQLEETLPDKIRAAEDRGDTEEAARLKAEKLRILTNHPGFSRDVLAYHTITDTWTRVGSLPEGGQVTTRAVRWGKAFVIPSGEISPGIRTPRVRRAAPQPAPGFGTANYVVLILFLAFVVAKGVYFARREKTTDDYFKAGKRIPWWAAGISIFATGLSAITFMSIPAMTFATDWHMFMGNMAQVLAAPIVVALFVPFYCRLNVTTAYEYLEKRFNLIVRLMGAVMFLAFQIGRIAIVLYLPSLALSVVTGVPATYCILIMGVLSIVYTVLGGLEAVIWTDVTQAVVLMGGGLLCLFLIAFSVDGGVGGMLSVAMAETKLNTFNWDFSVVQPTFWVIFLGGAVQNMIATGSDQSAVQRMVSVRDEKAAARAVWTSALMAIPASLVFFGLGTALFVFYKEHPQLLSTSVDRQDAIFPWFIVTQLPAGVAGILIAGLFAAAMSSLDSSMNSSATVLTTDFYRRFHPDAPDEKCLRLAKLFTLIVGCVGILFALIISGLEIKSLWMLFLKVLGLFIGSLGGLFLLGILSTRAHGRGAFIGLVCSWAVQLAIFVFAKVHPALFAITGLSSCMIFGYAASLVLPSDGKSREGVTIYTLGEPMDEPAAAAPDEHEDPA